MRITNGLLQRRSLEGIQRNLQAIAQAQEQISSGLRVSRPSEDPVGASGVLRANTGLRALEQYRDNISSARARLDLEEGTLNELTNSLSRAKELGVGQMGSTATATTRSAAQVEVDGIRDFVRELGNQKFNGIYLYGGDYADQRPFPPGGPNPLQPPDGVHKVEIGASDLVETNHSGQVIFIDSGADAALTDLSNALASDDNALIAGALQALDGAFHQIQNLTAEVGARENRLDVSRSNLDSLEVNLKAFRSDIQDADLERSISDLVNRQMGYQAALAANARILSTTLTDYLR